jgi:hypothetical protein
MNTSERQRETLQPARAMVEMLEGRALLSASLDATAALHGTFVETAPAAASVAVHLSITSGTIDTFTGTLSGTGLRTYYVAGTEVGDKISFNLDKTATGSRVGAFSGTLRANAEIIGSLDFKVGTTSYGGSLHLSGPANTFITPTFIAVHTGGTTANSGSRSVGSSGTTTSTTPASGTTTVVTGTTVSGSETGAVGTITGAPVTGITGTGGTGTGISDTGAGTGTGISDTGAGTGTGTTDTGAGTGTGSSDTGNTGTGTTTPVITNPTPITPTTPSTPTPTEPPTPMPIIGPTAPAPVTTPTPVLPSAGTQTGNIQLRGMFSDTPIAYAD